MMVSTIKTKHSIVAVQLLLSSSWETSLQNNTIFHWLGANLESPLNMLLFKMDDINGLVQDCSNSTANALELLQSCTKPSIECLQAILALCVLTH